MQQNFFDMPNQPIVSPIDTPDVGVPSAEQNATAAAEAAQKEKQNRMQRVMEYINSLPENQREAAMKQLSADFGVLGRDAGTDMARADALRQKAPQGRTTGSNQLYQSANPLEFLAAGMNNVQRRDEYNTGLEARTAARTGADAARRIPMEEMLRRREPALETLV